MRALYVLNLMLVCIFPFIVLFSPYGILAGIIIAAQAAVMLIVMD